MNISKTCLLATVMLGAVLLASCASGPSIRSDYDRSADFASYRTFGFAPELGTDRAGYSTLITDHFKRAVTTEMEARGYEYTESSPDLLANFYIAIREQTDVRSTPAPAPMAGVGYFGYRRGLYTSWPTYPTEVETVHYKTGTANVDLVDADRKQLIWEGVAEGRVKEKALAQPGTAIETVVAEIFTLFPSTAGTAK